MHSEPPPGATGRRPGLLELAFSEGPTTEARAGGVSGASDGSLMGVEEIWAAGPPGMPGLSSDWIFHGDTAAAPPSMGVQLLSGDWKAHNLHINVNKAAWHVPENDREL